MCRLQIDAEKRTPNPDQSLLELWEAEWGRLVAEEEALDPMDEAAFQKIRESYIPVMIEKDTEGCYWKKGLSAEERENFLNICRERVAAERAKWPQRLSEVPLPDPAAPWSKYECEFQYEILQDTINTVETICSFQIEAEEKKPNPDQALIQFWFYEKLRLYREMHDLKIDDEAGTRCD